MNDSILNILSRTEVWASGLSVAAFLSLFWVVRGAPLGQSTPDEPEGAPSRGYRDLMTAISIAALLLIAFAASIAVNQGIAWSVPLFVVGFGALLLIIKKNEPYRHISPTLRRVLEFANTGLTASLLGGILIVLNVVSFRYGGEAIDFTRERAYSLSSLTVAQLKSLERPLRLTIFLGRGERAARRLDRVEQLLDLFKAQNPSKISVDSINPFTDMGAFEELIKRVPDAAILSEGGVALEYGEEATAARGVVSTQELFQTEGASLSPAKESFQSTFHGEDVLTSGLIRLREGKVSRIAFTVGHAEPSIDEMERSRPGLGYWRARMASVGLQAIKLNLTSDEVPADVKLMVIVAPQTPFQPQELDRIRDFIVKGGRLLLLLGLGENTGLENLLKTHNLVVGSGHVFDPRLNLRGPSMVVAPVGSANHPVVDSLVGQQILLPNPRPLEVLGLPRKRGENPTQRANPGVDVIPLLFTSQDAFATATARFARPDPAKDQMGPLILGAAATTLPDSAGGKTLGQPLLIVYASPYLADNQFLTADPSNLDLLMNSINWLRDKAELQGIAPKTHVSLLFTADPNLRMRLHLIPTLLAGLVIVAVGVLTYLSRRQ